MALSVHTQSILRLIAQLANSDIDGETISTQSDVRALAQAHSFSPPIRITGSDVTELRSLRTRLRAALVEQSPPGAVDSSAGTITDSDTVTDSDSEKSTGDSAPRDLRASLTAKAAQLANELFRETHTLPQLQKHDQWDWHLHAVPNESGIAVRAAADIAIALADVVIDDEVSRFGTCAAEACDALFVDLSRNRSKRFCDRGNCANRTHVAAYRARLTEEDAHAS
ncbi:CGNR zinc finger domain-containing protein [Brevibacterium yomogidense]|uniref:CGNR zinc finger domain-containing protein n=1 Tax=Brevibacterium yomogidense TaxID=946573 RepID=UPI0018DF0098|nr:CGNR zinc finger domain-containing protein [Brevibacterium yomogidense]